MCINRGNFSKRIKDRLYFSCCSLRFLTINYLLSTTLDYARIIAENEDEFVQGSVIVLSSLINAAILQNGACLLGLSGGSTPKKVYEELGKSKEIDWSKVWVCLVDERFVPADHDNSNQKLVRETLLKHASIPEENLLFPDTSLPIEECVLQYHVALFHKKPDVLTLGIGEDGHIASLFPPVGKVGFNREKHIIHTTTPSTSLGQATNFAVHNRLSMTLPVIERAETKVFLLRGEKKKKVWEAMEDSKEGKERWPAKEVIRSGGVTLIAEWKEGGVS